jgi:hypothetical protein
VYRFKDGVNYLYVGWTVEKVQLVTIDGVNRAQLTERKINYTFPDGQTKQLSSKPVDFVTSVSLPIKDKPHPTPKPKKFFDVYVTDIFGNILRTGRTDDIENFRAQLNRSGLANGFYILHFENKHEKFIKL